MTTTIAQQLDEAWPSTSNGLVALEDELNIEGQSAEGVISQLAGNGVTSIEYDEVARALTYGSETAQAIAYFQDAVKAPPHDLVVEQEALRAEGDLYYNVGQPATGHDYVIRSIQIFSGHLTISKNFRANDIAQSYLNDASYQLNISCRTAATDIMAAKNVTSQAGGANTTNASSIANEQAEYNRNCSKAN